MAENRVRIIASVKDDASGKVTGIRNKLRNLGKEAKTSILAGVGVGAGIGAFNMLSGAVSGAVGYMKEAVRVGAEEVAEIATLTQAIKENDAAWDGNIEAVEAVIGERQKLGFEDAQQRASLQGLVSVTGDLTKAFKLNRTAMDLSRLKNIDLRTASELIGKVYAGNLGTLSRYGIVLEKGATATEAIAEIQRRAAGQAEAYGNTTQGAMETAELAFGDLQEEIGKKLLPVMTELALFTRDTLVPVLGTLVEQGEHVATVIDGIAGAFGGGLANMREAEVANHELAVSVKELSTEYGGSMESVEKAVREAMEANGGNLESATSTVRTELGRQKEAHERNASEVSRAWVTQIPRVAEATRRIAALPRQMMVAEHQAIRAAAYQGQVEFAKGLLDGQNAPKVAMDAALQLVEEELTQEQEVARLKGSLITLATARGIAAQEGKTASVIAIDGAMQAARDRLTYIQGSFYQGGYNIGVAWANGLRGAESHVRFQANQLVLAAKTRMMGLSPPKEGPLKDIDKGGFNIVKAWAEGMASATGFARSKVAGVAGAVGAALMPGIGSAGLALAAPGVTTSAGAFAGGGGAPVVIQLQADGRTLAEVVDRNLYYLHPARPSVLPRGT